LRQNGQRNSFRPQSDLVPSDTKGKKCIKCPPVGRIVIANGQTTGSFDPFLEDRGYGRDPDIETLLDRMEVVARAEADEATLRVQELVVEVHDKHVFLVVEPGDDAVGLLDFLRLASPGSAPRGKIATSMIFASGKSLRSSRVMAPMPSATSAPLV